MEVEILNVFGKKIVIYPESLIVNVVKYNEKIVNLIIENQFSKIIQYPIMVEEYGVTADKFISEFQKQNMEVMKKNEIILTNKKKQLWKIKKQK